MKPFGVIILAAGIGKRMHSKIPKVLHPMCGKPMLWYVAKTAYSLEPAKLVLVVGKNKSAFENSIQYAASSIQYVIQDPPLGTGDAVIQTKPIFEKFNGALLVLCGDVPLLKPETLKMLLKFHHSKKATATILTANVPEPDLYGRIVRKGDKVLKIVEHTDASSLEKEIPEINSGIYAFEKDALFSALDEIKPLNAQNEYYLTDTIEIMGKKGLPIYAFKTANYQEILGINTRKTLSELENALQTQIISRHQLNGVTISNPQTTRIDLDVCIGKDTMIHSGAQLLGNTQIGKECEIGANTKIVDSKISFGSKIGESANIENATL